MISIGGYIVVEGNTGGSGDMYKYQTYKATKTLYIHKAVAKKKKTPNIDQSILVQLGGPFEQIGGNDEAVGGGSQKVG